MSLTRSGNELLSSTINGSFSAVLTTGDLLALSTRTGAGGVKELVGQLRTPAGDPVGTSFVLKSYATGFLDFVSVTPLANGRFAIAWAHNTDEFGTYELETGIFNSDGSIFKAPEPIGSNLASRLETTALADGGYVLTYYDRGIKTVTFNANGTEGATFAISSGIEKATAGLKAGGYVTVAAVSSSTGNGSTLKAHLRKSDGQVTETSVATTARFVGDFKVVGLANGNFAVVWEEEDPSAPDYIKAQIVNAQGGLVGGQVTLYQHASADFQSIKVEALIGGGFALGFVQAEPQHDVYLGTYSETGDPVTAPILVNQQTQGFQGPPTINILQDGRILVGWYDDQDRITHYQAFSADSPVPPGTDTGVPPGTDPGVPPGTDPRVPPGTDVGGSSGFTRIGTKGKDVFVGGAGNDKFYGGYGNDKLTGLGGADVFVFNAKLGTAKTDRKVNFDTITDFKPGEDKIWLDNAIFKKLGKAGTESAPAGLNKKFFKLGKEAGDKNDYVIYDKKTGILSYDADGSGAKEAVEIAKLSKKLKLSDLDFAIV